MCFPFTRTAGIATAIAWAFAAGAAKTEEPASPYRAASSEEEIRLEWFEQKIRPVFVEKCYACHSAQAQELKGGLSVESRAALLKGGDSGPAIVPGESGKSLLMEGLKYAPDGLQMPPKEKLSDATIEAFERWINWGAPDSRGEAAAVPAVPAAAPAAEVNEAIPSRLRRPVALVLMGSEPIAYVANERSGSISRVDVARRRTTGEVAVGGSLTDLVSAGSARLLACDFSRHELVELEVVGDTLAVRRRFEVAKYPVGVVFDAAGQRAYVSSLWSRRITRVDLREAGAGESLMLDLPLAPRRLALIPGGESLVVADSFGGKLAILSLDTFQLRAVREIPAHNIRSLAVDEARGELLVGHTLLNEFALSFNSDVTWGVLTPNSLRRFSLAAVLNEAEDINSGSRTQLLGVPGQGGADPAGVAVSASGLALVPLAGAGQLAFCAAGQPKAVKIEVGARPSAVVLAPDEKTAWVALTNDDAVAVIDVPSRKLVATIPLGPPPPVTPESRGERLFFDARIAHDRWMSCHTCHTDGHTNGAVNDNLSDGSFGAAKRVLSLMGVADTGPFAWNGKATDLAAQARQSQASTMQGRGPISHEDASAIAAYLRTLPPAPSLAEARKAHQVPAEAQGAALFKSLECGNCHVPPAYTSPETYEVGLVDSQGEKKFNPPSLRGVSQRERYFHDNRAGTLAEVFTAHHHQLPRALEPGEVADLVAFLQSL